jgi:hypothetical protein
MSPRIKIIKRDSYSFPITFEEADGTPLDITGYTIFFTVKTLANADNPDTSAIIQKDITTHTHADAGESLIELTTTDTDQTAGEYLYDVQIKSPTGAITSCESGEFEIMQDITKRTVPESA